MKVWYLKYFICTNSSDEQSAFDGLSFISFLSLQLNEFPQSKIKQNYLQFKKLLTAVADKKTISVFCISGGIVLPTSGYCSNYIPIFFSLTLFSPAIRNTRGKS